MSVDCEHATPHAIIWVIVTHMNFPTFRGLEVDLDSSRHTTVHRGRWQCTFNTSHTAMCALAFHVNGLVFASGTVNFWHGSSNRKKNKKEITCHEVEHIPLVSCMFVLRRCTVGLSYTLIMCISSSWHDRLHSFQSQAAIWTSSELDGSEAILSSGERVCCGRAVNQQSQSLLCNYGLSK